MQLKTLKTFLFTLYQHRNVQFLILFNRSVRLNESGIYQKWLSTNTYDLKEDTFKQPSFGSAEGCLDSFAGPLWIFGTMLTFAVTVFLAEVLYQRILILVAACLLFQTLQTSRSRELFQKRHKTNLTERRRESHLQLISISQENLK